MKRCRECLEIEPRITARVYAVNEPTAFGAMQAIWKWGLHIPEDITMIDLGTIKQAIC